MFGAPQTCLATFWTCGPRSYWVHFVHIGFISKSRYSPLETRSAPQRHGILVSHAAQQTTWVCQLEADVMKSFALPAALLAGLGIFAMTAPATAASSATLDSAPVRAVTPTTMQYV